MGGGGEGKTSGSAGAGATRMNAILLLFCCKRGSERMNVSTFHIRRLTLPLRRMVAGTRPRPTTNDENEDIVGCRCLIDL